MYGNILRERIIFGDCSCQMAATPDYCCLYYWLLHSASLPDMCKLLHSSIHSKLGRKKTANAGDLFYLTFLRRFLCSPTFILTLLFPVFPDLRKVCRDALCCQLFTTSNTYWLEQHLLSLLIFFTWLVIFVKTPLSSWASAQSFSHRSQECLKTHQWAQFWKVRTGYTAWSWTVKLQNKVCDSFVLKLCFETLPTSSCRQQRNRGTIACSCWIADTSQDAMYKGENCLQTITVT